MKQPALDHHAFPSPATEKAPKAGRFTRNFSLAALTVALSLPAMAASLDLANDQAAGKPGKFAAEEIRREPAARSIEGILKSMQLDKKDQHTLSLSQSH